MKKLKWQILIKTAVIFSMLFVFSLTLNIQTAAAYNGTCGSTYGYGLGTIPEGYTTVINSTQYPNQYKLRKAINDYSWNICDYSYSRPSVNFSSCYDAASWSCYGDTNTNASCSAPIAVSGKCGTANQTATNTAGRASVPSSASELCTWAAGGCTGMVIPPSSGQDGSQANPWRWTCCGENGGAAASCMACNIHYHWIPYMCMPNTCQDALPANSIMYPGDSTNLVNNTTSYSYSSSNTGTMCEYYCNSTSYWNGSSCIAYSCTGNVPANASMFAGDNVGLTANTSYSYSSSNTGTMCQYSCNSGYSWNGTSCVTCTGTVPANASMFAGDNAGLTVNTPYTYSATDTGTKCQYSCNTGYTWDGVSSCVAAVPNCGTVTDASGNTYNTVILGTQCWMIENLRTTKKPDGTSLTRLCYSGDSSCTNTNSGMIYGGLYDWATMMNGAPSVSSGQGPQGICPTGWHIPTDAEWTILSGSYNGIQLQTVSASTFSGILAGNYNTSSFFGRDSSGVWWSSTEYSASTAWPRSLSSGDSLVARGVGLKTFSFSVRCLKGSAPTYKLTINAGDGTEVKSTSDNNIDCKNGADIAPGACSHDYASGTNVPLTETTDASYNFTGWSGSCSGTGTCSVTMDAAKTVTTNASLACSCAAATDRCPSDVKNTCGTTILPTCSAGTKVTGCGSSGSGLKPGTWREVSP